MKLCVTSGRNARRAALKAVMGDSQSNFRMEITNVSTADGVKMEDFMPVLVGVDPDSWILSPEATARSIPDCTAAIVTIGWLGTICNLCLFRKLADKCGAKLISDSAQSFGAIDGKPPALDLADVTIYSTSYQLPESLPHRRVGWHCGLFAVLGR